MWPCNSALMEYLCHKFDKVRSHIFELYTILTYTSANKDDMVKWGQDIQESLELEEWHSIAHLASKSLIKSSIIEAKYKVLLRCYMVPARLATYVPETSHFWGCGPEEMAYHIWWQCRKVRQFWIRVYNLILTLTQINLTKSPKYALLGCKVDEALKNQRRLLTFFLVSTKITTARNWKSAVIPFDQLKD